MKICITSAGESITSIMDPRFGRAAFFIIYDTDTKEYESLKNEAAITGGGAGITSGQLIVDKDVKALITGNVGPNAMNVLKAADITIYKGLSVSVKENIDNLNKGILDIISSTVPSHFGIGGQK
jgi:predicted Fe-Mo cluster-binding NifX family protein